ncbi:MAG: PD-(D/E)XK motif protein [Geminicoccaceae bacterium]|nr:PD-(D/E)XK motif protein [Geminicoccaceae bacterium]
MTALEAVWDELARQGTGGRGWLTRRLHPASPCPVFAAVVGDTGQPAILLDVETRSLPPASDLPAARGFEVGVAVQRPGPGGRLWLALTLTDPGERTLFGALAGWEGPEGGLHDWRRDGVAVEVKGTTADPPLTFGVSHAAQLDETRVDHLLVCHHALIEGDEGDEGDRSLTRLVGEIEEGLQGDGAARDVLARRLLHAGYHASAGARYERRRFCLKTRRTFRVQDGFPRLRPDDLPAGIAACVYSVTLAACLPFAIDGAGLVTLLQGTATR